MDLSKIIKIEKGGGTTTLPPFKESIPNIQVQKVVQPTVINSLDYSTDKVLQGIIKKVEKQEIPAKQSPVVVFSGEINKKIQELLVRINNLHKVSTTGDYNDLINKPNIQQLIQETKQELTQMLESLGKDLVIQKQQLDNLTLIFSQHDSDAKENFKEINLNIEQLQKSITSIQKSYNNLQDSVNQLEGLRGNITSINNTLYSIQSTITSNTEAISNLQTEVYSRISELESCLATLQENINKEIEDLEQDLEQKLQTLQNNLQTEITTSIYSIDQKVEQYKQHYEKTMQDYLPLIYAGL